VTRGSSRRGFVLGLAASAAACGRRKTISRGIPSRIVSQVVDADEILWDLGEPVRGRVVGVSAMADDRRYATEAHRWPSSVPRVPGAAETLLAAEPDLVIVAEFSAAEVRDLLERSGIRTVVLTGFDGFDDYRRRVRQIAVEAAVPHAAQPLLDRFDARLAEVRAPSGGDRPRAVSWVEGSVAGSGTSFDDVATTAGLTNIAAAQGIVGHRALPLEQVVGWDPEVVVTQCEDEDCGARARALASAAGWSATSAARDGRIVAVPSRLLFSAGWGMVDAARWIARQVRST
jgi:iron complex transport system substrate-binding protein